jgi:hypothetical protein
MEAKRKSCFSRKADGVAFIVNTKGVLITGKNTVARTWPDVNLLLTNIGLANHVEPLIDIYFDPTWLFALRDDDIKGSLLKMYDKCKEVGCTSVNVAIEKSLVTEARSTGDRAKEMGLDIELFLES